MSHPQTIQIFLPAGDPQGVRTAEITTRIVRLIEVPRSLLSEFLAMPEAEQVGVYFLFGEDEQGGAAKVYIGQTGSLKARLTQHNAGKEFWNRALVAVSLTDSLTNTHASYLEWLSIQKAQRAGRYLLENGNSGGRPHTPAPLQADCAEIHDTLRVLLATLGYPVFEPLSASTNAGTEQIRERDGVPEVVAIAPVSHERIYYCHASGADAQGIYTKEGFVVLAGSTGRLEVVPSFQPHGYNRLRDQLFQQGVISAVGDRIRFERDYLFKAPSAAAACIRGRTANGPLEWRDAQGRSLWDLEMSPAATGSDANVLVEL
jgi:hypothetical protein